MAQSLLAKEFEGLPTNWGRWGNDDEVGSLNFLTPAECLRGMKSARSGKQFPLSLTINNPKGEPVWPGRTGATKLMTQDRSHYTAGKLQQLHGGLEYADDYLMMFPQGSTQFDALGHTWYDGKLYNGYDAETTVGSMGKASVLPLAQHTATGRGVLIDMPRHRKKARLDKAEQITLKDMLACAKSQGIEIQKHDIILVRTGFLGLFFDAGSAKFYEAPFIEPGLVYSRELVEWFHAMEIPLLGSDSIANEITVDPNNGLVLPLHSALMRNLGIVFNEIMHLDELADECAKDGNYDFFYTAAPLKIFGGAGAPVSPIAIK